MSFSVKDLDKVISAFKLLRDKAKYELEKAMKEAKEQAEREQRTKESTTEAKR
jgi:hypothetical protein